MTSLETRIQKVNQAFCDMLGYEESELIGRMVAEVTHPEDTGGTPESAKRLLGGAESIVRLQKRYIRKDGTSVEAKPKLSLVKDSGGRPLYAVAMIEDVTEQREARGQAASSSSTGERWPAGRRRGAQFQQRPHRHFWLLGAACPSLRRRGPGNARPRANTAGG